MSARCLRILSAFILVTACQKHEPPQQQVPAIEVTDFVVEPKTIPAVFEFIGFADSPHPVEIRARVEGYLDKIAYNEGQQVKKGDLLFQLDPKQFEAIVERSKGEVMRQEAILANARLTVERLTRLYEQKAASKKDLDNAVASQLAAEASLQSAQAQLLNNQINLAYTTMVSPITGYADKAKYREGALISPQGQNLLTTVSVLDPIWVYFSISDSQMLSARQQIADRRMTLPQDPNAITLPLENQYNVEAILSDGIPFPYKGKVDFSSPTYDQGTGTLQVRAVFPNPQAELRPGQFARIKLYGAERPNALYVPQRALMQKKGGMFVYVINEKSEAVPQDVDTGEWYGDYQIITNGLKRGDRIVVDGTNKVRPGSLVSIKGPYEPVAPTQVKK